MSPYNAYSTLSKTSSYSPSTKYTPLSTGYTSLSSSSSFNYRYPTYTATKYRSPNLYVSSTTPRSFSSSYLNTLSPSNKLSTVSRYTSAITNDSKWKLSSDISLRSPSLPLSRRGSSITSDWSPRTSLSTDINATSYKSPSWSSSVTDEDDNLGYRAGLNNLGNTCFMNAVLQCLCHTIPLVNYCTAGTYLKDINHRSPTRGDLMRVFAEFVVKITETKARTSISPYHLRREVQRYAPTFLGDNQQDAQEFLRYLLQGLHDDINRVTLRSTFRRDSCPGDALRSWKRYQACDDSFIVDLFAGQLKSTLKCTVCNNESITYDPFWDLSLPIPEGTRNVSLRQCFNLFSSPEILDGHNEPFCEKCKKKSRSSKKIEVSKFPKILVIHLKRFSASCYGQKLNTTVDCPLVLNNVTEFASRDCMGDGHSYSLYGVVDHDGSNSSGHYTSKCRNPVSKEWFEFNDMRVSKAPSTIVTYKAYILFYTKDTF